MTLFSIRSDASKEGPEMVYTLAGCIAHADQWDEFDASWKAALGEFGLKHFHMKEFEGTLQAGGFGEFAGWKRDDPRRVPLLTSLVKVIGDHTVGDVAFSMPSALYTKCVPADIHKLVNGSPYYFLFGLFWSRQRD